MKPPLHAAMAVGTVACALLAGAAAAHATTIIVTFDTPTTTTAQTEVVYGMSAGPGLASALVNDGQLVLDPAGSANADFLFGAFAGDLSFAFDTTISGAPGNVNVGYSAGSTRFWMHPGYWGQYFVNGAGAGDMGFTPGAAAMTHVEVQIVAATKTFTVRLSNGAQSHQFSYVDAAYVPGTSLLGFTVGATGGANYGLYDNLQVVQVPEPPAGALLALGLAALAAGRAVARRRS